MKFVEVKEDPRLKRSTRYRCMYRHDIQAFLEEFVNANIKFAKIEYDSGEYGDLSRAYTSIYKAVTFGAHPIECLVRDSVVYLVRTDM